MRTTLPPAMASSAHRPTDAGTRPNGPLPAARRLDPVWTARRGPARVPLDEPPCSLMRAIATVAMVVVR